MQKQNNDSLRLDSSIHKILLSTPSFIHGEIIGDNYLINIAHPDYLSQQARINEGPSARTFYVLAFQTKKPEKTDLFMQNYAPAGAKMCAYLSVLFGKRFDSHGLIEGGGFYHVPDLSQHPRLVDNNLPFNSRSTRADKLIDLNFEKLELIAPILGFTGVEKKIYETFDVAAKYYLQALQNYETDAEVAYLHLITAIEILSNHYKFSDKELLNEELLNYLTNIREGLDDGEKIASIIKKRILSVKKRFILTVLLLLNDNFYEHAEAEFSFARLTSDRIRQHISAAYDLRSNYVHTGFSFGKFIYKSSLNEIQTGTPDIAPSDIKNTLRNAPTFIGLERIVRYCLLRYLQTNGIFISEKLNDSKEK